MLAHFVSRPSPRRPLGALAVAAACAWPPPAPAAPSVWHFDVTLDGSPVGQHEYALTSDGAQQQVTSVARLRVKLLGITLRRYDHRAQERWAGGCLVALDALTDDDGRRTEVHGAPEGGAFAWEVRPPQGRATRARADCPMTFAYWNPAIASRRALLDPGSGRLEAVRFEPLEPETIEVEGAPSRVRGLRILGLQNPVDLWYLGERWVGLDTRIDGHALSYRLH